jgi:hypothetical protein
MAKIMLGATVDEKLRNRIVKEIIGKNLSQKVEMVIEAGLSILTPLVKYKKYDDIINEGPEILQPGAERIYIDCGQGYDFDPRFKIDNCDYESILRAQGYSVQTIIDLNHDITKEVWVLKRETECSECKKLKAENEELKNKLKKLKEIL